MLRPEVAIRALQTPDAFSNALQTRDRPGMQLFTRFRLYGGSQFDALLPMFEPEIHQQILQFAPY